jgi:hypothetical protein
VFQYSCFVLEVVDRLGPDADQPLTLRELADKYAKTETLGERAEAHESE